MRLIRLLKHDLSSEVASWEKEGIITLNQAELICSRYGIDYHDQSRRSYGYYVLMGLGGLFIGLAVITLIGANWDQIPRAVRMCGMIALTLCANLFGLRQVKRGQTSAGVGWLFLGSLFYGASIMLIAQIYHIGEHYPDGIFWWAIGVLPIAVVVESVLIMMLAVGLGFIWFFVETSLHFYPVLFPVFLIAIFWILGRGKQSNILFLALVAGLGLWAEYSLSWIIGSQPGFRVGPENAALGAGLLIAFHGLSKWLAQRKDQASADYGPLLGAWVLRGALITLFVLSFKEPWQVLIRSSWHIPSAMIALSILLSAIAIFLAYKSRASMISTVAFVLLFIAGQVMVMEIKTTVYAPVLQVADNFVLIFTGIWLIISGIQNSISHYFYLGVLTILITGLLRYVDLVGDYIGASILFAVLAAVLLLTAKFWQRHLAGNRTVS